MEEGSLIDLFAANRWLILKHCCAKIAQPMSSLGYHFFNAHPHSSSKFKTTELTSKSTHLTSFGGNGSSAMPSPKDNGCSCWIDPVGKTGTCNTKSATQNCKLGAEVSFF